MSVVINLPLALLPIVNLLVMSAHDIRWEEGAARFVELRHFAALPRDPLVRAGLANNALFADSCGAVAAVRAPSHRQGIDSDRGE